MTTPLIVIGFVVFWIVLNRWVLPRFGIETCMSGACTRVTHTVQIDSHSTTDKVASNAIVVDATKAASSSQ